MGYALGINPAGHLEFWVGNGSEVDCVTAGTAVAREGLVSGRRLSYDRKSGRAQLYQEGVLNRYNSLVGKVVPYDFASHVVPALPASGLKTGRTCLFLLAGARDEHALRGRFVSDLFCRQDRPPRDLRPGAHGASRPQQVGPLIAATISDCRSVPHGTGCLYPSHVLEQLWYPVLGFANVAAAARPWEPLQGRPTLISFFAHMRAGTRARND